MKLRRLDPQEPKSVAVVSDFKADIPFVAIWLIAAAAIFDIPNCAVNQRERDNFRVIKISACDSG
jgi:hypothetical protein